MLAFPRIGVLDGFLAATIASSCPRCPRRRQDRDGTGEWIPARRPSSPATRLRSSRRPVRPSCRPLKAYAEQLEKGGYRVIIPPGIEHRRSGYLAGTDEERADELNRMIRDPQVRAIFPVGGGYGLTRILDRIDYAALRKDPKIITGFSDLTGLHLAVARQARLVTFHSPMPMHRLWQGDKPEHSFAAESFRRAVFADQDHEGRIGLHHRGPGRGQAGEARRRDGAGPVARRQPDPHLRDPRDPVRLAAPKGAILLIEDVNEAPYRVDRMLSQLRLAGVLDAVAGVVAGSFSAAITPTPRSSIACCASASGG